MAYAGKMCRKCGKGCLNEVPERSEERTRQERRYNGYVCNSCVANT